MLLAVDPGINACGCALFHGRQLVHAYLVRNQASTKASLAERVKCMAVAVADAHPGVQDLVIEVPVFYRDKKKQKGRQQDLITLALVAGAILARLGVPSVTYFPYEWKRQMPKRITRLRVESRLSIAEASRIELPAASLQHNVFDSLGVGLHHLGRVLF